ncbi:MAG: hypothetical protein JWM12_281 [Ilumatobacteraceae bacterium]|nr:hypothetical protein [Ilumatobacteraceae bacterium]
MLILIVSALVILAVPLVGGRLGRLSDLRIRDPWLVLVALVVQVIVISVITGGPQALWRAAHLATYGLIGVFLYRNRAMPRLWIVMVGGLCNLVAISANGGVLPASQRALAQSGRVAPSGFANSASLPDAHLSFLGDIFYTPGWMPFANVFSIGDATLIVGLAWLTLTISRIPDSTSNGFIAVGRRRSTQVG